MTWSISPIRKTSRLQATHRPDADEREPETDASAAAVARARKSAIGPGSVAEGAAVFSAQLLGQDGQKRGLRGGPETLGAAQRVYTKTEYSGSSDRRAPKGRATKTKI